MASGPGVSEFDLIRRHFVRPMPTGILGPGDDCALLPPASGQLAVSTDLLIAGRHFFTDVEPSRLGHKALAVNLSDLAAMGARPLGCTLGLALPSADDDWLAAFAAGWHALAERWQCPLIGGDTTRAYQELAIAVTVMGEVPPEQALRRAGGRIGDDIWVSGSLGAADVALHLALALRGEADRGPGAQRPLARWVASLAEAERHRWWQRTRNALELPEPRVGLGLALRGIAHAALDISDGLLQDLGHVLAASGCGAEVWADHLPLGPLAELPREAAWQAALGGGDAYELCFTAPPLARSGVEAAGEATGVPVSRIGRLMAGAPEVRVLTPDGGLLQPWVKGYDHFA